MLQITLHPVALPLRHAWTLAHGTRTVQEALIVALHDPESGHVGYGEGPVIPYMGVTIDDMIARVQRQSPHLIAALCDAACGSDGSSEPGEATRWVEMNFGDGIHPSGRFIRAALDEAAYDLHGKRNGRPTHQLWADAQRPWPRSDYTLGLAEPEVMVAKLREYPDFPVYKIKLGLPAERGGRAGDLAIVRRLRQETAVPFRVDANTAWTAAETIALSEPLRELGVEFIEQPLRPDLPRTEHEAVFFGSTLPVIADESCQTEADVEPCAGLFHGINLKLSKCGGITPARRIIAHARRLGLRVMAGCMTETSVGISALAQLLPLLDDVDMDGALLLQEDIAQGVTLDHRGLAQFPSGAAAYGNGVHTVRLPPALALLPRTIPAADRHPRQA